jgi:hypothetical protein
LWCSGEAAAADVAGVALLLLLLLLLVVVAEVGVLLLPVSIADLCAHCVATLYLQVHR